MAQTRKSTAKPDHGGSIMKPFIVTTTCSSPEEAEKIARAALAERLAACVQISPVRSMYWWKGTIESEHEYLLNFKSRRSLFDRLALKIKEHHSYEVPEIIAADIEKVDRAYAAWLKAELAAS